MQEDSSSLSADEFDFDHKEKLGTGAFGVAYKISWQNKGAYCIKCIDLKGVNRFVYNSLYFCLICYNSYQFSEQVKNAQKESVLLKTIDSPHVIQYFGSFTHNDTYYIVTELASSGDLKTLIQVCITE